MSTNVVRAAVPPALEGDDRRMHQRIEIPDAEVEVVLGDSRRRLGLDSMSEGGALIAGKIDRPVGTVVQLVIRLARLAPVATTAKIMRHQGPPGEEKTAVAFQDLAPALREHVHELVLRAWSAEG